MALRIFCLAAALLLVLFKVTTAQVPTGCVQIKSAHKDLYLGSAAYYNTGRQHVTLKGAHSTAEWNIVRAGEGYRIQMFRTNHDLFASSAYTYDNDRRYVFIWDSGPVVLGTWDIQPIQDGAYSIRNRFHNEYLYSADYPSENWIFTWRRHINPRKDGQFHWFINECS